MAKKDTKIDIKTPKNEACEEETENKSVERVGFFALFRYADCFDVFLMIIGTICAIGQGSMMPAFSLLFGEMIDILGADTATVSREIGQFSLYFLYIAIFGFVVSSVQTGAWQLAAERQLHRIRIKYLRGVLKQEMAFFDKTGSNQVYARMSSDMIILHSALGENIASTLQYAAQFVVGFGMGLYLGWQLTLVILAVSPLLVLGGAIMMFIMATMTTRGQRAYAKAGAIALEMLTGIRTVASLGAEQEAIDKYNQHLAEAKKTGVKKGFAMGGGIGFMMLTMFGSYGLAFWYGATMVADPTGGYTAGTVIAVFFAVLIGSMSLGQMGPGLSAIANGRAVAFLLYETIQRESRIDPLSDEGVRLDDKAKKGKKRFKGHISFRDVSFRYETRADAPVLNSLSFDVKPGTTVALVGESGCGKSSTLALLQRFYDADGGEILVDGVNVKELNLKWWRQQIGFVQQEPVLFSGSVRDNIVYGLPDGGASVTDKQVIAAAKLANAHEFIKKLPKGYHTLVGSKGAQLSGGQKQRVAIARAIITNPTILLLDEATSALDTESEHVVQAALDAAAKDRTTLVIAHRLATVRDADRILVIADGRVAQSGTFDELAADKNGAFYKLIEAQGLGEQPSAKKRSKKNNKKLLTSSDTPVTPLTDSTGTLMAPTDTGDADADAADEEQEEPIEKPFRAVLSMNKPEWWIYVIGVLFAAMNGAMMPIFAVILGQILTALLPDFDETLVPPEVALNPMSGQLEPTDVFYGRVVQTSLPFVYAFVGIGVYALVVNIMQLGAFISAGERLTERIRRKTFERCMRMHMSWFDDKKHAPGVVATRLATDATLVKGMFGDQLSLLAQNILTLVVGLGIAFFFSWKYTLIVLATVPLIMVGTATNAAAMKGRTKKSVDTIAQANGVASESIANVRTVASFTCEQRVCDEYEHKLALPLSVGKKQALVTAGTTGFGAFCMFGTYGLNFYLGGLLLVDDPTFSFEAMFTVLMVLLMSAGGLARGAAWAPNVNAARAATHSIFRILRTDSEIDPFDESGLQPTSVSGKIAFRGVRFVYPTRPDAQVLDNFEVESGAGKSLALCGESGCGKSTTIALLERFYDCQEGTVELDGRDVRDYNLRWLRRQIALVGQEPTLFSGTIADNIRFGCPDATDADIEEAARAANAHNFVTAFPDGYATDLGENGTQLSGGQKQRIAIARALVRKPRILLLDEATSALDTESERIVQEALDRAIKSHERSTVIVAHRLSTIKGADKIAVVGKGKVLEEGKHKELLKKKKHYYKLTRRQQ